MEDEQLGDSVERELKMHKPFYPLPPEIQQMERAETACSYCGVSYLILHEFQRLQEQLREAERQVEAGRGALERERAAMEQLQGLRAALQLQQDRAAALESQVAQTERELQCVRVDRAGTRVALEKERQRCLRLGSLCSQQLVLLREAQSVLRDCGSELCGVREHISLFYKHVDTSRSQILHYCSTTSTECDGLRQEVGRTGAELVRLQGEVREMGVDLDAWRLRAQTLESQVQNQDVLQNQNLQAHLHVQALKQEVESLKEDLQKSHRERKRIEGLLEAEQKGAEEALALQQHQSKEQGATILRLSLHLREKEASWLSCQRQCESLQQQLLAWQQKGEEMTQRLERAKGEREELKAGLNLTHKQTTALLQEREALKNAQRDEIRELQAAFRKRLEVTEEQRSKLEECVLQEQAERQRQLEEIKHAALELHTHRQKNLELINTHQTEYQQLQEKLHSAMAELQGKVSSLELLLCKREEEVQLLQERVDRDEERQQGALELQRLREERTTLQEENALLQETVRRECEERTELTAALSEARDQLMRLSMAAKGPPDTRGAARPPPLPGLAPGHAPRPGRDPAAAASWHGASRPTTTLPRLDKQRAMSVSEQRQHVAMAMGKKSMH